MHYCVLMHQEIPLLLHVSTNAYTTRQGNNYYVYHNVVLKVAISNGCPASTVARECSTDHKGTQKVCEPTDGSILARVDHV